MTEIYEFCGLWEPTATLRFVERNKKRVLQQRYVQTVKVRRGRWCFSKTVTSQRYKWQEVDFLSPKDEALKRKFEAFLI
jgi:hypothetical protein